MRSVHCTVVLVVASVALAGTVFGCDRNTEAFVPESPAAPDLARIFPAPEKKDVPGGAAGVPQPAGRRGAAPVGSGQAAVAQSQSTGPGIRGSVRIAEGASVPAGAVLFVIARPGLATAGPPLAVLRIPDPGFPLAFEIGPEHVMIPSMSFEGEIGVSARLDTDGNAMTRDPSDLRGRAPGLLAPGATDVELVLGPGL